MEVALVALPVAVSTTILVVATRTAAAAVVVVVVSAVGMHPSRRVLPQVRVRFVRAPWVMVMAHSRSSSYRRLCIIFGIVCICKILL